MNTAILFYVLAGERVGLGHIMRCLAIAEMVKDEFDCLFFKDILPVEIQTLINNRGFECTSVKSSFKIVILDGYDLDFLAMKERFGNASMVYIDDLCTNNPLIDAIVNHAPLIGNECYKGYYGTLALGMDYAMVNPMFYNLQSESVNVNPESVLIALGGRDEKDLTLQIAEIALKHTSLLAHMVLGRYAQQLPQAFKLAAQYGNRIVIHEGMEQEEMKELMQKVDCCIVSASTLLYEAVVANIPAIAGYYVNNQEITYRSFTRLGACIGVEDFNDEHLINTFKKLNTKTLSSLKESQRKLIDGHAGNRFKALFSVLLVQHEYTLRKAMLDDVNLYFEWSNDSVVRKNSLKTSLITWETHAHWFDIKMKDEKCVIYILEKKSIAVGQIRFDFEDNYWMIDYSIARANRGSGLGLLIVKKGILKMRQAFPQARFRAIVKKKNRPSINIFERLNSYSKTDNYRNNTILYEL